jgi:arsenate reductase-like glutaredoxin family protein
MLQVLGGDVNCKLFGKVQMLKIKLWISTLLLVFFISVSGCAANSQQAPSATATTIQSHQELAKVVLSEVGIAAQYDLHLGNSIDLALNPAAARNAKFVAWLQAQVVQKAGWKYAEAKYVTQLQASFSEQELKQLLTLAKQPLMKKLLRAESQAYADATSERRRLLDKFWNDYNSGLLNPPPEVLP